MFRDLRREGGRQRRQGMRLFTSPRPADSQGCVKSTEMNGRMTMVGGRRPRHGGRWRRRRQKEGSWSIFEHLTPDQYSLNHGKAPTSLCIFLSLSCSLFILISRPHSSLPLYLRFFSHCVSVYDLPYIVPSKQTERLQSLITHVFLKADTNVSVAKNCAQLLCCSLSKNIWMKVLSVTHNSLNFISAIIEKSFWKSTDTTEIKRFADWHYWGKSYLHFCYISVGQQP